MKTIEYRVRPVTRYIVTRFESETHEDGGDSGGSSAHGTFDNNYVAQEVAYALCKAEHDRLGWAPGDPRMIYPEMSPGLGETSLSAMSAEIRANG